MVTILGMEEMATEGTGEVDHPHHLMTSRREIRVVRFPKRKGMIQTPPTVVMTVMMIPMMTMMKSSGEE